MQHTQRTPRKQRLQRVSTHTYIHTYIRYPLLLPMTCSPPASLVTYSPAMAIKRRGARALYPCCAGKLQPKSRFLYRAGCNIYNIPHYLTPISCGVPIYIYDRIKKKRIHIFTDVQPWPVCGPKLIPLNFNDFTHQYIFYSARVVLNRSAAHRYFDVLRRSS